MTTGLQILAEREHVAAVGTQVLHPLLDLLDRLAEPPPEAGFGGNVRMRGLETPQQRERARVIGAGPHGLVQTRLALVFVFEHVGRRIAHDRERDIDTSTKVGHQHFDLGLRRVFTHGGDTGLEVTGAAIAEIVAIDGGDHHVYEIHRGDGACEIARLLRIECMRPAVRDVAERTAPRADVAHDHEGRRAVTEALAEIGTRGLFALRVQTVLAQHRFQARDLGRCRRLCAYAIGFTERLYRRLHFDRYARDLRGAALTRLVRCIDVVVVRGHAWLQSIFRTHPRSRLAARCRLRTATSSRTHRRCARPNAAPPRPYRPRTLMRGAPSL